MGTFRFTTWALSLGALCTTTLAAAACGDDSDTGGGGAGGGGAQAAVTFHEHVEPILQKSCLSCHTAGRIGSFSLHTYADAAPLASSIAALVLLAAALVALRAGSAAKSP